MRGDTYVWPMTPSGRPVGWLESPISLIFPDRSHTVDSAKGTNFVGRNTAVHDREALVARDPAQAEACQILHDPVHPGGIDRLEPDRHVDCWFTSGHGRGNAPGSIWWRHDQALPNISRRQGQRPSELLQPRP